MEQIKQSALTDHFNPVFFTLCFGSPVCAFIVSLFIISAITASGGETSLTGQCLTEFLTYYDQYMVNEFLKIFSNNFFIVVLLVYFTPLALLLRRVWQKLRSRSDDISAFEKVLLYLFPAIFLIRQAVNIAVILNGTSTSISKNVMLIFTGIILPHGLPELLAVSLAGAIGMEVTRRVLFSNVSGPLVKARVLGLLGVFTALCAFVEVYFTPKIFSILMVATGIN
ncbi:stage II sporulation protein M [Phosphitispora fastidiosa]|uniref:stage II sporulation protein M n=1 Tax=Phosphitispora fastidiosa TaxID=2837202 RepID=UPI001E371CF1|nr:stage II sporulation protein M [Phosphitispora fastidiosa]MBU7008404.1 putative membrane protein SpoIIM required for sporulation [Phosphitispora fastidiosa]